MGRRRFDNGDMDRRHDPSHAQEALVRRAEEAIEYLMECNGHTELTKTEFAAVMAGRVGRIWLRHGGMPNKALVEDMCNLTRDQHSPEWAWAADRLGGYVVGYAPNKGGMTLTGLDGEMGLDHLLHLLCGDAQRDQAHKTINRRRIATWREAGKAAMRSGDFDLGSLLSKIENEIDATGFVSDSLYAQLERQAIRREVA